VQFRRSYSTRADAIVPVRARCGAPNAPQTRGWSLALILLAFPTQALAQAGAGTKIDRPATASQTDGDQPPTGAVDHYLLGRRWYLAGRYRDALVELKAALELDPNSADLLYNVARVYENLRQFDEAIAFYQRYAEALPIDNTEERQRTDKTIGRLQGAKREFEQQQRLEHEQAAQSPAPSGVGRADFVFWLTGGAAIALLAAGSVTGVMALRRSDEVGPFVVGQTGTFARRQQLAHQAEQLALTTDVLLGSGVAAFAGALLLFLLRDAEPATSREADEQSATGKRLAQAYRPPPAIAVGFGGLQLHVEF
jgi:tetratricopeptide (TPR) repeat protein